MAEESLQGDSEVQNPKNRLTPSNSYLGARQANWKKYNGGGGQRRETGGGTYQGTTFSFACPTCGKQNGRKCMMGSSVCYRCGKPGHMVRECGTSGSNAPPKRPYWGGAQPPRGGYQRGTTQARVYSLTPGDAENARDVVKGNIRMLSNIAIVLFDSRATHSFISPRFVKLCGLKAQLLDAELAMATPLGSIVTDQCSCSIYGLDEQGVP
ncbi:cold shock domain-containing protein 4-like [Malania oleifera]|uniref:cold shock domain-containing protein 4-like n=1 Tax=Malania oleifera TaxID=397392 RepID=UPI0025ADF80F|nr:cold shock domain-containing protein 4-like [Malania oleifera]